MRFGVCFKAKCDRKVHCCLGSVHTHFIKEFFFSKSSPSPWPLGVLDPSKIALDLSEIANLFFQSPFTFLWLVSWSCAWPPWGPSRQELYLGRRLRAKKLSLSRYLVQFSILSLTSRKIENLEKNGIQESRKP